MNRKANKAITVRLEDDLYAKLVELAETNPQTITHVVTGCTESAIDLITQPGAKVTMPRFFALCRLSQQWEATEKQEIINEK